VDEGEDQNGPRRSSPRAGDLDFAASFNGGILAAIGAGVPIKSVIDYLGDNGLAAGESTFHNSLLRQRLNSLANRLPTPWNAGWLDVDTYLLNNSINPSQ